MITIKIKTMGCRLNHAEAATIAGALVYEGFDVVDADARCDMLVLHTCVITAAAQNQVMRLVRSAKRHGVGNVVLSGCATSIVESAKLFDAGVDVIVDKKTEAVTGNGDAVTQRIGEIVARALSDTAQHAYLPAFTSTRASVKVQDGCDFRCAYCIVPDTRGEPRSRSVSEILEEIAGLAQQGFREVVLTGVNVACWRDGGMGLADLAREAAMIDGLARIRLSSVEPGTAERALVDVMAEAGSRLCHMLHYPLQSGDAGVLRRMCRRYTPDMYRDAVSYALSRVPRLGLGADVITGFPGEDDAAFAETVRMIETYPFSNLHVFPYSERPGTPAAVLDGVVPVHVRRERTRELIALGARKREVFASSFVGEGVEVLVERVDAKGIGRGWTSEYVEARVGGLTEVDVGQIVRFEVESATEGWLFGCAERSGK